MQPLYFLTKQKSKFMGKIIIEIEFKRKMEYSLYDSDMIEREFKVKIQKKQS